MNNFIKKIPHIIFPNRLCSFSIILLKCIHTFCISMPVLFSGLSIITWWHTFFTHWKACGLFSVLNYVKWVSLPTHSICLWFCYSALCTFQYTDLVYVFFFICLFHQNISFCLGHLNAFLVSTQLLHCINIGEI